MHLLLIVIESGCVGGLQAVICYLRINHNAQIFLTRPSVWSCERHGCHPLEKIPADLSDAGWAERPSG